jgi:steroid delta-isomerase-like uncharacterized protein
MGAVDTLAPTSFDPARYVKDFESAWNRKDPDAFLQHYAENVEFQDPAAPKLQRGKEAARTSLRGWFEAFSEMQIRLTQNVVNDRNVALLYECNGRHTGELEIGPGERIPPTNKSARVQVAEFTTLGPDGKVVKTIALMDSAKLLQQLGVMPTPGAGQAVGRQPVR